MGQIARDKSVLTAPAPLQPTHAIDAFDCGVLALDDWLKRRARRNEMDGASRSFVACDADRVVGYYCLAAGSILHGTATGKVRRNMPDPVPILILGRLAVDRSWHGHGLGADLLSDAARRTVNAAQSIGIRALLVHAIPDQAAAFYEKHGFRPSAIDPMTLMITIDEITR